MTIKHVKQEQKKQKETRFKDSIYQWTQVNFAYNSNKIGGNQLTQEQTEMIFETNSFITQLGQCIRIDDLMETLNHFRLFDYMLDVIDEPLNKGIIIQMNMILKRNTSDETNPRYNVGGLRVISNIIDTINGIHTSFPENIEKEIDALLKTYHSKEEIDITDIIDFHVKFERIHPFSDGNGRVGRMIMFKECLKNGITPFVIRDLDKNFYNHGLKEYDKDQSFLIDTCLRSQSFYEIITRQLLPELNNVDNLEKSDNESIM